MVSVQTTTPVQRHLLGNQIADALRKDVIFGVLKPGTRISQQQLCARFGTSRMPVRDGLRTLVQEGLMHLDNARHIVVSPLSRDDLLDAFQIESMLTGLAAQRASERATKSELDQLDDLHKGMLDASKSGRQKEMVDLNWQLHRQINHMAGSRKLIVALRKVSFDLPRDYLEQLPEWNVKSNKEHAAIIKAMRAGEHAEASSRMADHVMESGKGLVAALESQGVELG